MSKKLLVLTRKYFTLMELLVVLAIISTASVLVGFSIYRAVQEQRFRSEVSRVVEKLRMAQDLMLILNIDMKVHFTKDPSTSNFIMTLDTKEVIPPNWKHVLKRNPLVLERVKHIFWDKNPINETFSIVFSARGLKMSRGNLRLSALAYEYEGLSNMWMRDVLLRGYPAIINAQAPTDIPFPEEAEDATYLNNLTLLTRQEIDECFKEPTVQPK